MSRHQPGYLRGRRDVPRASGDEPGKPLRQKERIECSPRERG